MDAVYRFLDWHPHRICTPLMGKFSEGDHAADYSYLDAKDFESHFKTKDGITQIRLYVQGINCAKCVRTLESLSGSIPGLGQVNVEIGENIVTVEVDRKVLPLSYIPKIITERGFTPVPLADDQDTIRLQKSADRRELIRLAVAGACAGNIMTFAFAVYSGADPSLFLWLSFVLYLPVVSYVAWPFYKEAANSLLQRRISIDLPMAIASFTGFAFSTFELARGSFDGVYFDSLAGFLFLILTARFAQRKLQKKFGTPTVVPVAFERVRCGGKADWKWKPIGNLKAGEEIQVQFGESLPCDAELLDPRARFSLAWLSGESNAKIFLQGAVIPAGARLAANEVSLRAVKTLPETHFGAILDAVQKFTLSRNKTVMDSDRWAQWLLAGVFTAAALYLAIHWSVSPDEAIARSLALIVLACPCAMAFGTPLALTASLKNAHKAGLLIRDAGIFYAAQNIKTIFFDKTGTVTETKLSLKNQSSAASEYYQRIILGLENGSLHPIAFAFREAYGDQMSPVEIEGAKEIPGMGVEGRYAGKNYRLVRTPFLDTSAGCALFEDGKLLIAFKFEPGLVPDCRESLDALRAQGYKLELLSGDSRAETTKIGLSLGFTREQIHFELSPEVKAKIVSQTPCAMMVGDGINDSLALIGAQAAVAVSGGVESALKCAGAYLDKPGLGGVVTLLNESRSAYRLIRMNLTISVVYNLIGGTAALLGYINPLMAAVLMPVSSGFILLATHIGSRR